MEQPTPTPPAAPPPPETISATRDAANRGDFNAFDKAATAARVGKPLADVEAPPTPAAAAPAPAAAPDTAAAPVPPPAPKKYSLTQDELNDRVRTAVDAALADARRLATPPSPPPSTPSASAPTKEAEHKRYLAMPDAPKLDQFESIEEHAAAMAVFIADKRYEERETARQQHDRQQQTESAHDARLKSFDARVADAKAKDPAFLERVKPIASQLMPTANAQAINAAIARGEIGGQPIPIGPLQALADEIIDSDQSAALLDHFQAHPDDFEKFATLRSPREVTRELARIEARLTPTAAAPTPAPKKLISDAPPPPPIISNPQTSADPKAAAIARGDFVTFDKLEMQAKRQQRQPGA